MHIGRNRVKSILGHGCRRQRAAPNPPSKMIGNGKFSPAFNISKELVRKG